MSSPGTSSPLAPPPLVPPTTSPAQSSQDIPPTTTEIPATPTRAQPARTADCNSIGSISTTATDISIFQHSEAEEEARPDRPCYQHHFDPDDNPEGDTLANDLSLRPGIQQLGLAYYHGIKEDDVAAWANFAQTSDMIYGSDTSVIQIETGNKRGNKTEKIRIFCDFVGDISRHATLHPLVELV